MNISKMLSLTPHFGKGLKSLFTFKELENLLNLRPFVNKKRFIPTGLNTYQWRGYDWQTEEPGWPSSQIKKALNVSSAYIRDASKANKKINGISEKLEKVFKCPVDCHIYFSLNKNVENFGKHKDTAHNYIVICEGKLNIKIYINDKIMEKTCSKGDTVFIPAGLYHNITSLTDKRLSCSFPVFLENEKKHFEERKWLKI